MDIVGDASPETNRPGEIFAINCPFEVVPWPLAKGHIAWDV